MGEYMHAYPCEELRSRWDKQLYQPAFALEMDVLRSHHLVISPSTSADHRKPNSLDDVPPFRQIQSIKVVPETYIPVILKMKAQR